MLFAVSANSRALQKRRTYDAYSDEGPPCWVNVLMFIGAVGCLISSVTLFSDSIFRTRETKVEEFSETIANWSSYRNDLLRSNFSVSVEIKDKLRHSKADLHKDSSQEISGLIEEEDKNVPSYLPLKFAIGSVPHELLPTLNYTMPPDENAAFVITATFSPNPSKEPITTILKTASFPLWTKKVVPGATPVPERKCPDQQHGTWIHNRCEIYRRLISICVLVDLDKSTGTYSLAPQRKSNVDSYGCDRKVTDGTRWNPAAYTLVRATASVSPKDSTDTIYAFPETTLDDVSITVRSAHDPLVEAEKVTNGSLDFGLSAHNSLVLGILLLVIGAMLSVSPAIAIRQSCRDYAQSTQSYSSVKVFDDEFDEAEPIGDSELGEIELEPLASGVSSSGRTLPRRTSRPTEGENL